MQASAMNKRASIMAETNCQREAGDSLIRGRSVARLAHENERDLMNTLRTKGKGSPGGKRFVHIEWLVDAPFSVEVRERRRPHLAVTTDGACVRVRPERTRYVKLGTGFLDRRPPGSPAGLHWDRRTGILDS